MTTLTFSQAFDLILDEINVDFEPFGNIFLAVNGSVVGYDGENE